MGGQLRTPKHLSLGDTIGIDLRLQCGCFMSVIVIVTTYNVCFANTIVMNISLRLFAEI